MPIKHCCSAYFNCVTSGTNVSLVLAFVPLVTVKHMVKLFSLLSIKNSKIGQSILRKMIKICATRCQILRLKCTKFDFGWGSAPDRAGGDYSTPQTPSWINGVVLLRGGGWEEGMGGGSMEGKGKGGRGLGEGKGLDPLVPLVKIH